MGMPRVRVLSVLAVATLALPATAQADAQWSAPQNLSSPHLFVDAPSLAFGGDGTALATWSATDGQRADATFGVDAASRPRGADAFGPQVVIAAARTGAQRATQVSAPVTYGTSRALAATQRQESADVRNTRLAVVFGDTAGHFGSPRTIAVQPNLRGVRLAADTSGDAAVAWWQDVGVANDRVYVALRRPGGSFGAPILLATDRVRSVSVAVSPRGDVLVAWDARGAIRTRIRAAAAHGFGAAQTIVSRPTYYATIHTAMTARGRAYVAWTAQLLTEGGDRGPFTAEVAVRPVGSTRFRSSQLLEEQQDGATQAGSDLAVDGEDATFAWSGLFAGRERVRVASTDSAAIFGDLTDVSPEGVGGTEPTVALDHGRRLVAWVQGDGDSGGMIAAGLAPPHSGFGAPELISSGPEARLPVAGFAPTGRPTVVWSNRPAGSSGPIASIKTYAQASTRTG